MSSDKPSAPGRIVVQKVGLNVTVRVQYDIEEVQRIVAKGRDTVFAFSTMHCCVTPAGARPT